MASSFGDPSARRARIGAVVTLVGGVVFSAGVFLPLVEDRSLWVIEWRSSSFWVRELVLYILPPVLIIGAAVVGLVAVRLAQAAGGAAIGLGLTSLVEWAWFQTEVDWGTGWWALVLGAALSLAGGVILVVQTQRQSALAAQSAVQNGARG
jgi:hypothetical protein